MITRRKKCRQRNQQGKKEIFDAPEMAYDPAIYTSPAGLGHCCRHRRL
jgi:hypothetical protein